MRYMWLYFDVVEIKCKVVCRNCGTILKSCADL